MKNDITQITLTYFFIFALDLQGNLVKMNAVSTITKSLPVPIVALINYSI